MAFSATKLYEISGVGGVRTQGWDLNFASVTEGILRTGMNQVLTAVHTNEVTEADGKIQKNKSAASTTENGAVFCSSFTSNDTAQLVVTGR